MALYRSLVVLLGFALMWAASSADPETGLSEAEGAGAELEAAGEALLAERLEDRGIRAAVAGRLTRKEKIKLKQNEKCNKCKKSNPRGNCDEKCGKLVEKPKIRRKSKQTEKCQKCIKKNKNNNKEKCAKHCNKEGTATKTRRHRKISQNNNKYCRIHCRGKAEKKTPKCQRCPTKKPINGRRNKSDKNGLCEKEKLEGKKAFRMCRKRHRTHMKKVLKKSGKIDRKNTARVDQKLNRASTINLTCLTTAIKLIKYMKDNVGNFLLRHSRQQKQNALSSKKMNKKGQFAEPAARLVQAGGGNKSNLTCGGSTTSVGAKQLLNLTMRLDNCSAKLMEACAQPDPSAGGINQTFMTECYKKSKGYNTTLMTCMASAIKGNDACSCFMDTKLVGAMTDLKNCSGKAEAKMAAKVRTRCLVQMRSCNSDIEEAGRLQYTCKYTVAYLKEMLAQITNNKAKVTAGQAKVKALTGVSAAVPGNSTNSTGRVSREVEGPESEAGDRVKDLMLTHGRHQGRAQLTRSKRATYTCASLATSVTSCTTVVSMAPSSKGVLTACTITTTQTSVTCTTTEKAALQTAADSLDTAQRIFTAFMISLQAEIKDSSGATVSSSDLATLISNLGSNAGSSTSTKAASGRNRNILRKMIMDKMKK